MRINLRKLQQHGVHGGGIQTARGYFYHGKHTSESGGNAKKEEKINYAYIPVLCYANIAG